MKKFLIVVLIIFIAVTVILGILCTIYGLHYKLKQLARAAKVDTKRIEVGYPIENIMIGGVIGR